MVGSHDYLSRSLPHVRGGVSIVIDTNLNDSESSPRPWGCFSSKIFCSRSSFVFPTSVGVFLWINSLTMKGERLPHVRGGVSDSGTKISFPPVSSPRPWGCFSVYILPTPRLLVFPTSVGVFLFFVCRCFVCYWRKHFP